MVDDDVEQAVVVEIVHDRAAGLVEAIDPHEVADVPELADVELGVAESSSEIRNRGSTLPGYSPRVM